MGIGQIDRQTDRQTDRQRLEGGVSERERNRETDKIETDRVGDRIDRQRL